jgi:septum formation protein
MNKRIILASGSPRRLDLLQSACFEVEVRKSDADETWPGGDVREGAISLAARKLAAVGPLPELALAADTIVVADNHVLGKPADEADARRMLRLLAGAEHQVITGFVLRRGDVERSEAVVSKVRFRDLTNDEIDRYVACGDCKDKAGSYGIQGEGGSLVDRVEGSYTNIVGLPLAEVLRAIKALP